MKSWKSFVPLVLALAIVAAACGEEEAAPTGPALVTPGTLTVCTDAPYPPMEIEDPSAPGGFTGFDIELMRAIATEMGLGLAVINSGFDPITSGSAFLAGDCDIAAASITIRADREQDIDFSAGYFFGDQSFLVKSDSGITALDQTSGQRIAVQSGTTGELYAQANAPSDTEIVSFENPGDLFLALEAGDVVGILQDIVVNGERLLTDPTVTLAEFYPTNEFYGFAVANEGSEILLAQVNEALWKLRFDGTYDQIFADWFG
ncbi:MAG: transporter substrate-binding domain-containing protein [Acidimicrobiia bacterium]